MAATTDVLQTVKQCCAVLDVLREELATDPGDSRKAHLIGAALNLAEAIYVRYWEMPDAGGSPLVAKLSGQLRSILQALQSAHAAASSEGGATRRGELREQASWLQYAACDIAENLAAEIEQEPPRSTVRCVGMNNCLSIQGDAR